MLTNTDFYTTELIKNMTEEAISDISQWPPDKSKLDRYEVIYNRNNHLNLLAQSAVIPEVEFEDVFSMFSAEIKALKIAFDGTALWWDHTCQKWRKCDD